MLSKCLHTNFFLLENELGTFVLVKVASMQWDYYLEHNKTLKHRIIMLSKCLHNNFFLLENELGTFVLVKVASMQWGTLVKM